jgi:hypothetical protein
MLLLRMGLVQIGPLDYNSGWAFSPPGRTSQPVSIALDGWVLLGWVHASCLPRLEQNRPRSRWPSLSIATPIALVSDRYILENKSAGKIGSSLLRVAVLAEETLELFALVSEGGGLLGSGWRCCRGRMEFQTNMIASFIVDRCPVSSAGCLRSEAGQISAIEANMPTRMRIRRS